MTYTNRRNFSRFHVDREAQVIMPNNSCTNYPVCDISMEGILLTGTTDFLLGTYCTVSLTEKLTTCSVTLNFTGQLVRKSEDVIAIQFLGTDQKTFDLLQTIILYQITDPVSFCEELTDNIQLDLNQPPATMRNSLINEIHMPH